MLERDAQEQYARDPLALGPLRHLRQAIRGRPRPNGFCDEARTVLCRAHYILARMRKRKRR